MSDTEDPDLTPCQARLLAELAGLVEAGPGRGPPQTAGGGPPGAGGLEAFCGYWRGLGARARRPAGVREEPQWAWVFELRGVCEEASAELDALSRQVEEMEQRRQEVAGKTALLHEQCRLRTADMDRLSGTAGAILQRLDAFDSIAQITRFLDEGKAANSPSDFDLMLQQIERSAVYMESHYDFNEVIASGN